MTEKMPVCEPGDIVSAIHDVIAKVRSRNNMQLPPEAPHEATLSLAEMHRMTDAEAVFHAYMVVFGHAPDLAGFQYYVNALRRGALNRRQFLDVLQKAASPKVRHIRILHDATEQELEAGESRRDTTRLFYTQDDFACEDVNQFLTSAYHAILKRAPDPGGISSYQEAMENGTSRADILASLLASDEYKGRNEPVFIQGVTPSDHIIKHLFNMIEGMSANILVLEYQFLIFKNK